MADVMTEKEMQKRLWEEAGQEQNKKAINTTMYTKEIGPVYQPQPENKWGKYAGYAAMALNLAKFSNPYAAALGIAAPIAINYYLNKRDPHKKKMEAQMAMQESAMMNLLGKQKAQAQATQLTPAQRAALNRAGQTVAGRGGAGTQKFLQYGVEAQAPGLIEQTIASGAAGMTQTSAALDRIVGRRKLMSDEYRQSVAGVGKEVARFVMPELTSVVDATEAAKGGEGVDYSSLIKLIELVGKTSTTPTV